MNDDNYPEWTKHFMPGSQYESDWEVGGRTLFLGPDGRGILATITKLERPFVIIFNHLADIIDGVETEILP